jgi:hypothetical protein
MEIPGQISAEIDKRVPGGEKSWLEQVLVSQYYVNSIIAITLIVIVLAYIQQYRV